MSCAYVSLVNSSVPIYQTGNARVEIAQRPLSIHAVNISLEQQETIFELNEAQFAEIWEARNVAERYLSDAGYHHRLCYSKLEFDKSPVWQTAVYVEPDRQNHWVFRKISSIWQQAKVLFRTIFPPLKSSDASIEKEKAFWGAFRPEIVENVSKTGEGPLTNPERILKQIIYPKNLATADSEILLLYNYAPLKIHFLLIPNPNKPARNFLELDKEQYVKLLMLVRKIAQWVKQEMGEEVSLHFFDKTGEIASQNQPLFHAHLIIVKKGKEELWGKLALFLRMLFPPRPLAPPELEKQVVFYRQNLGHYLRS